MKMRIVFIGEYHLSDNLKELLNAYGSADPIECAKVDFECASDDPWVFLNIMDSVRVAGVEPVNE